MSIAPLLDRSYAASVSPSKSNGSGKPVLAEVVQTSDQTGLSHASAQVDRERLQAAVDAANDFLQPVARNLQFSIDEESGRPIVKVIDNETNKVVRQIPSEEMLAISRALGRLKGVMVEQHA